MKVWAGGRQRLLSLLLLCSFVHILSLAPRRVLWEAMQTRRLAVVGLVSLTAAELFSGACASNEGLASDGLCGEESAACAAPGDISGVFSATEGLPIAKTEGERAGGKRPRRRRRVGFSHEDVAGDESLRPFVQSFRDSLSANVKGTGFTAERDGSEEMAAKDTSIPAAEEEHEVGDMCRTTADNSSREFEPGASTALVSSDL